MIWIVNDELNVRKSSLSSIGLLEQEMHITRLRVGYLNPELPEIQVTCSDQTMITRLSKSEFFILNDVVISSNERNKDFILEISGNLELNGLTIRKKKHVFTSEERKMRADRMRKLSKRNKVDDNE